MGAKRMSASYVWRMNGTPDDTPYCRLYFTTGESRAIIQAALDEEVARQFPFIQVHAPVYKESCLCFSTAWRGVFAPWSIPQWTAEVDTLERNSPETFEAFQLGLIMR